MSKSAKLLVIELNKYLDEMDASINARERANILSKILDIPKQQAWALLEGQLVPDVPLREKLANELEIDMKRFE